MTFPVYLADSALPFEGNLAVFQIVSTLPTTGLYLWVSDAGVALCKAGEKGQVRVDFVSGSAHHRRTQGGGELIARAVNHTSQPVIWDATGGLGRDAFVLASLGLQVTVFEQHPVVACLLADGLARAAKCANTADIVARIQLITGDATQHMPLYATQHPRPDVVYLDPMYPMRQKSAAVKKEMAYFHDLVGNANTQDDVLLLATAQMLAKKRVVVKRPRLGEYLAYIAPAYQYHGKSTRFDVYLPTHPVADSPLC